MTGAELGDYKITILSDYLKGSKKLKVLKLIKNKLTDDCLSDLLIAVKESNLTSLNLSQNTFSDKSVNILETILPANLKTITLSLNKINRRNVKTKIEGLLGKGLNVLL